MQTKNEAKVEVGIRARTLLLRLCEQLAMRRSNVSLLTAGALLCSFPVHPQQNQRFISYTHSAKEAKKLHKQHEIQNEKQQDKHTRSSTRFSALVLSRADVSSTFNTIFLSIKRSNA